jgi:hypothetical protein
MTLIMVIIKTVYLLATKISRRVDRDEQQLAWQTQHLGIRSRLDLDDVSLQHCLGFPSQGLGGQL